MKSTMKIFAWLSVLNASICITCLAIQQNATIPVNVGIILDAETRIGKLGLSCIRMALSDFYASHGYYKTRLVLHIKDSKTEVIAAASAAMDLIENVEVKVIIGPQTSKQANFLIDVGQKSLVPFISFSATSPSLTSPQRQSPYFFRVAQNDATQVQAISTIVQAFGWNNVVPIYSQGIYEEELIPYMTRVLLEENVHVPYQIAFSPSAIDQQIHQELHKLKIMSTRVFIVHVSPELGYRLFTTARNMEMMSQGYVWIMTTRMSNLLTLMHSSIIDSMQGVIGVRSYVPKTKEFEDFNARWKEKFQLENPSVIDAQMNVLGLWAYDATTALAMAVEKVASTNLSFQKKKSPSNATNIGVLKVSQIGQKLRVALSNTKFQGLGGEFSLVGGEVNSSTFEIINIIGDGKRVVGYWTPQNGLKRKLDFKNLGTYSVSKTNLGPIIWPGDSSFVPIGWDELANTKKLRVGVPKKRNGGFREFVDIQNDPTTNMTKVKGYCIDVFKSAMEALPYNVSYEFIPCDKRYDDLINGIRLGEIDVAVGDITIMAKRSLYVDFTLPFTQSGATFIVPITKNQNKGNAWIFLKPLTWELWFIIGCLFVLTGFVVWVLEHPVNEEFQGSPSHQVSTSFWFSFSTLVFAQRERVRSSLGRFVVIIWVFVVLILTQSYTANLATQMTIKQLRPSVTDVYQLLQNGDFVGYQNGSYTYNFLRQIGFDNSKIKAYKTMEECDKLLQLGSKNGGIAATFDEIPYMKLILTKYCSKYTIMGPTYDTAGFGFAFWRGSFLVPNVSRAILKLTQGNENNMKVIEDRWFENKTQCIQPIEEDSSYKLDLESFLGLFLITGLASSLALIIHFAIILHDHRKIFKQFDSNDSLWKKIYTMFKIHYQKDPNFNDLRNNREQNSRATNNINDKDTWIPEVNIAPPSSSRYLNHMLEA